jgi:hypothetical protein
MERLKGFSWGMLMLIGTDEHLIRSIAFILHLDTSFGIWSTRSPRDGIKPSSTIFGFHKKPIVEIPVDFWQFPRR